MEPPWNALQCARFAEVTPLLGALGKGPVRACHTSLQRETTPIVVGLNPFRIFIGISSQHSCRT